MKQSSLGSYCAGKHTVFRYKLHKHSFLGMLLFRGISWLRFPYTWTVIFIYSPNLRNRIGTDLRSSRFNIHMQQLSGMCPDFLLALFARIAHKIPPKRMTDSFGNLSKLQREDQREWLVPLSDLPIIALLAPRVAI